MIITILNWVLFVVTTLFLIEFLHASVVEKEPRAATIAFFSILFNCVPWYFFIFQSQLPYIRHVNIGLFIALGVFLLVSLLKFIPAREQRDTAHMTQYDERDYMFSRNRLKHHPHLAQQYYAMHPEKKEIDVVIHAKPDIGAPGGVFYDPYRSPMFDAMFAQLERSIPLTKGEPEGEPAVVDKAKITAAVKELAFELGAVDVGITPLKPYHLYSHHGRRAEIWGQKVETDHTHAVAIIVAMDVENIKGAPGLSTVMESSHQYVEAAKIANIIAQYIRSFGFQARAHTDGNYQVLCVPLAVDTGLGVLGRMGIFMHPVHGPCVRISAVTTDLELELTQPKPNLRSIETFCDICKKCAHNCPTQSISEETEQTSRGCRHWSIDQEACFSFWKTVGTDCGFCIRVCPYTKPDTFIHKLVRFYIARNPINQRIALFMDDFFYGRKIPIDLKGNPLPKV